MTTENKNEIYKGLFNLLTSYCNTCLDKNQKEKMLLCTFKLELIQYAETSGNHETADELWESIARILGMSMVGDTYKLKTDKCNCVNGVCTIC